MELPDGLQKVSNDIFLKDSLHINKLENKQKKDASLNLKKNKKKLLLKTYIKTYIKKLYNLIYNRKSMTSMGDSS